MSFICILLAMIQCVGAVFAFISANGNVGFIITGISLIISAIVYIYIASLGFANDRNEQNIAALQKQLKRAEIKFKTLQRKLGINDFDSLIEREEIIELSKIPLNKMESGFPVVFINDVKFEGKTIKSGTEGELYQRFGLEADYQIRVTINGTRKIVRCKETDLMNAYLHDLESNPEIK